MRLSALPFRILLSALLSAGTALLFVFMVGKAIRESFEGQMDREAVNAADVAACEANPERWRGHLGNHVEIFAYYPDGRSANPSAPPLGSPALRPDTEWGAPPEPGLGPRKVSILRDSDAGPCALFRLERTFRGPDFNPQLWTFGLGSALAMLAVALGSYLFTLRPILARIARIRATAAQVGEATFTPAEDSAGDALSAIATTLERSHGRILSDRAELKARHSALEQHLAEIAHDLRTPIASLQLAAEDLVAEARGTEERETAHRALTDVVYLSDLVENLHHGVRLRHGLTVPEGRVDLTELTLRLGRRFAALGAHAKVEVAVSAPDEALWVRCDPALAERAIANLLHNALTHGQAGGHVAALLKAEGEGFRLRILDDGPGIPEGIIADLSSPTFRADLARRRGPGLGLGIAQEIARRAEWTMVFNGVAEEGTEVVITGPRIPPPGGGGA